MSSANNRADPAETWRTLFEEQRSTLTTVAEVLLDCGLSSQQTLNRAMTTLAGLPVHEAFGCAAAVRAVVKAALAQNREAATLAAQSMLKDPAQGRVPAGAQIEMLPWPERAVYFLRQILRYSRRDTALLLGMSDAHIDQIHEVAERRIGHPGSTC